MTVGSALVTCLMLFINGSLVMAILISLVKIGPSWLSNTALMQFLLFSMPVVLVVLQWMMIDYVRTRLSESSRRKRNHAL